MDQLGCFSSRLFMNTRVIAERSDEKGGNGKAGKNEKEKKRLVLEGWFINMGGCAKENKETPCSNL